MERREALSTAPGVGEQAGQGAGMDALPIDPRLPPPGPPRLSKDGRWFDVGAYVTESTLFPFVLFESFLKYSDPVVE